MSESQTLVVDAAQLSATQIVAVMAQAEDDALIRFQNVRPELAGLAAGAKYAGHIEVDGPVGDFAFFMADIGNVEIPEAGACCGHSLLGGRLQVAQTTGDYLAAFAQSGFVVVLGTCGDRCAYGLAGGEVFIRSRAGDQAGCQMTDGSLILGNGAGEQLGVGMQGGTIYVRGEVGSISTDLRLVRMKDADTLRLSLMLARAGVKGGDPKMFKAYRPKSHGTS